jgi:hypothetical protein
MSKSQDFSKYLLRRIEHDGEYFTVKKTGRSGMSMRGLGRFVGKTSTAISYWVNKVKEADPINNSLPESLKPFAGKSLTLEGYTDHQGRRDILEDRFCSAIVEYYASEAHDAEINVIAKARLALIRDLGMRLFLHMKTGWHPNCDAEEFNQDIRDDQKLLKAEIRNNHKITYGQRREVLKKHGVTSRPQGWITRQDYQILLKKDTKELREVYGISKTDLIVDHLEASDQATLSFAHMMQSESLEAKNIHGYKPVKGECGSVMQKVVDFRDSLRSESQKQLPGGSN